MSLVLGASQVAQASAEGIAWAWFGTFLLAAGTLTIIWIAFPSSKQLIMGKDKRVSTSKFQAVMWTMVVVFALLSMLYGFAAVHLFADLPIFEWEWAEELRKPLADEGFMTFLDDGLDETYLLLLGFPLAGAIASKAITTTKVANGAVVKSDKEQGTTNGAQELIGDDSGEVDLGDFQYLLFNLVAVGYFLVQYLSQPNEGLPMMPDTLVSLTGVAAAAYVTKKGVYREPPILLGVLPPSQQPGRNVTIYGQRLVSTSAKAASGPDADEANRLLGTVVTFNGLSAEISGQPTDSEIEVKVPSIPAGPVKVAVLRPPGASSEEMPFTVLD